MYLAVAAFLLLTLLGGLVRILRGPTPGDRMLAAQLFGSTGVAILLLLAQALELGALRDVALAVLLLAPVNTAMFVHASRRPPDSHTGPS